MFRHIAVASRIGSILYLQTHPVEGRQYVLFAAGQYLFAFMMYQQAAGLRTRGVRLRASGAHTTPLHDGA